MHETMQTTPKTFRGRTLEDVLPQISAELGEDAIVLRCREGLRGGIFGFFRRPCVEIEATVRPPRPATADALERAAAERLENALTLGDVPALEVRSDRATAEGMASPAVRLLIEQAAPFADRLRDAQLEPVLVGDGVSDLATAGLTDPRLYGPQPTASAATLTPRVAGPSAPAAAAPTAIPTEAEPPAPFVALATAPPAASADDTVEPGETALEPTAPALSLPAAARTAESRLVFCGLDSALAAEVVGEAVVHGLPFGSPRGIKRLVRSILAQRLRTLGHRGQGALTLAVVGPVGAGTTTVVGHLAAAYARSGAVPVVVIALRSPDGGAALRGRMAELGVAVETAIDGAHAKEIAARTAGAMVLVDLPAVTLSAGTDTADLKRDLEALGADELHLALPATTSSASADELAVLLDPLGLTHVALTRMDDTRRPGAGLGFCISSGRPLSYLSVRGGIAPANATAVAQLLLP